jgi:ATP-dependent DNA helicase RecG
MRYLAVRYEMTGEPRRKEIPEVPYDALREAIINAVAHRDYFEKGANVMVEMFDDRIEITNFGGLVKGLKPEDFGKKSVLRNPNIAGLLHRVKYIEKMGTGINKMRGLMAEVRLPPIVFEFGTFFTAIFRRPARIEPTVFDERGGVFGGVFGGVNEKVAERMGKVIKALCGGQLNISQLTVPDRERKEDD